MQVRVVADVETWASWARNGGGVNPGQPQQVHG